MAFLLDTNVLSELRKGARAHSKVRAWAAGTVGQRHYVSVLALGEIRRGIEQLRKKDSKQAAALEQWLMRIKQDYAAEILPVSDDVADRWGNLMAVRTLPVTDGLIAATALEHGLTVATRNIHDFAGTGVPVVNPFA
jgi:predicted nucleic acid-binding protein